MTQSFFVFDTFDSEESACNADKLAQSLGVSFCDFSSINNFDKTFERLLLNLIGDLDRSNGNINLSGAYVWSAVSSCCIADHPRFLPNRYDFSLFSDLKNLKLQPIVGGPSIIALPYRFERDLSLLNDIEVSNYCVDLASSVQRDVNLFGSGLLPETTVFVFEPSSGFRSFDDTNVGFVVIVVGAPYFELTHKLKDLPGVSMSEVHSNLKFSFYDYIVECADCEKYGNTFLNEFVKDVAFESEGRRISLHSLRNDDSFESFIEGKSRLTQYCYRKLWRDCLASH